MKKNTISVRGNTPIGNIAGILLIFFPVAAVVYLVHRYAVNVPIWDEWRSAEFLIQYYEGNLHISDFFIQHNEHRLAIPFMVNFFVALVTHFNPVYGIYVSIALMIAILAILYLGYKREHNGLGLIFFIPVPFILFTLSQYANYLWGFEDCVYFCIFGTLAALYLLTYVKTRAGLLFAITAGVVASFSFFSGLLVWPVGVFAILASKRKRFDLFAWAACALVVGIGYFWGWTKPAVTTITLDLNHLPGLLSYFCAIVGAPMSMSLAPAIGIGFILLTIAAITVYLVIKNGSLEKNIFYLSALMFSLCFSAINAIGRYAWGLDNALMSRYTIFNLLVPISLYLILLDLLSNKTNKPDHTKGLNFILFGAFAVLILLGLLIGNIQGFSKLSSQNMLGTPGDNLVKDQYYLLSYKYQPDENLLPLSPLPEYIRYVAPMAEKYNLSVFYDDISPDGLAISDASTRAVIEKVDSAAVKNNTAVDIGNNTSTQIEGWAVDAPRGTLAKAVFVSIDGSVDIPTLYYLERDDVAAQFKNDDYRLSGFNCIFSSSFLGEGVHNLRLKIVSGDGKEMYATPNVTIEVHRIKRL